MRSSHYPNSSGAPQIAPWAILSPIPPPHFCALVFPAGRKGEGLPAQKSRTNPPLGWGMLWFPHYNQSPVPPIHLLEPLLFPLKSVCSWLLFPFSPHFPARHPPCPCPCPPPWSRVLSPWSRVPSPCFWGRGGPPSTRAPEVLTSLRLQLVRGYYSLPHLENYSFFRPFRNFNELF